jgi:hypothetical protein
LDHRRRPEISIQTHLFIEQIKIKVFDILFYFNFEVPLCQERRNWSKERANTTVFAILRIRRSGWGMWKGRKAKCRYFCGRM